MGKYVLVIDQGTTSSRAIIFDKNSKIVSMAQKEFTQYCPKSGWVEHDANEIWDTVMEVIKGAVAKSGLSLADIAAIGITNQRETTVLWDRKSGEPVGHALCWQSRQSQSICEEWIAKGLEEKIHQKTGLIINPYFSGSKIRWILDNVPGVREKAEKGDICFGTIDSFLVFKLTEGKQHVTDVTNASRTMIFNINDLKWDEELLAAYDIPASILPEVKSNSEVYGYATKLHEIENVDVPIASMVGDQQSSLFGQCCFEKGSVKNTYGTGCFMLMNTKSTPVISKNGLLTTIAWKVGNEVEYALEGSVFIGGSAIQWLRDGLRFFPKSSDCEQCLTGSDGVYVVPAFVGLGTPYWDNDARGAVFGLTRATSKENFVTATLESIAYQSKDVMEVMKEESGVQIATLAVDGGASANNYLMQFQADILDVKVIRPECLETTALGAAYLAGLATGVWASMEEIIKYRTIDKEFDSTFDAQKRESLYKGWKKAVEATRVFK